MNKRIVHTLEFENGVTANIIAKGSTKVVAGYTAEIKVNGEPTMHAHLGSDLENVLRFAVETVENKKYTEYSAESKRNSQIYKARYSVELKEIASIPEKYHNHLTMYFWQKNQLPPMNPVKHLKALRVMRNYIDSR